MISPNPRRGAIERAVRRYSKGARRAGTVRADGDLLRQEDNYRLACERAELRAEQVRAVAGALGVPMMHLVSYRCFGLHLDRLARRYSGATLARLAVDAVERYSASGLSPRVLIAICRRVFNLDP